MMKVLGVDPGVAGGLAVIEIEDGAAPQLVDAIDIPVSGVGAKERVDAIAIREWVLNHQPQPRRRRADRTGRGAAMKRNGQQQKLVDDARLLRAWRKWHREERETALAGPHGTDGRALVFILEQPRLGVGAAAGRLHPRRRLGDGRLSDPAHRAARGQRRDHSAPRAQRHVAVRRRHAGRSAERVSDHPNHSPFPRKRRHPERMPAEARTNATTQSKGS